jgi:hypothetical protein
MGWTEKQHPTTFDSVPIHGLIFLDGDVFARVYGRDWTKGQKYPLIAFPSGMEREIWESSPEQEAIVHFFGEMDLPYRSTRDEAFDRASQIAEVIAYGVRKRGEAQLDVWGQDADDRFTITYDSQDRRMEDIEWLAEAVESPVHPAHMLMNDEIKATLPPLYTNEKLGLDAVAPLKFFQPDGQWTWYASEGSPVDEDGNYDTDKPKVDFIFFGLVSGFDIELGYFSLSELQAVRGGLNLPIERDLYFEPKTLREIKALHERGEGGD